MRSLVPRPILLVLTLILVVGAIAAIELRLDASGTGADREGAKADPPGEKQTKTDPPAVEKKVEPVASKQKEETREKPSGAEKKGSSGRAGKKPERTVSDAERIASKRDEYPRAEEITAPTGFINTDGVSIGEAAGEKVVLLQFWTYSCFNCQNAQPFINAFHEEYADDGLLVIGVHKPEFEFEKDPANVQEAVRQENIRYPVVLDNDDGTWDAYDQRFWPAWYLIDADGFVRYKHFGEGAYKETEKKIGQLLAEKDRISN